MAKRYRLTRGARLVNLVFTALTRVGLGARYRHVLTVPGRRTGRLYSTPVDVMHEGGRRWLVAPYGPVNWVRNARATGEVRLARGRVSERARVVEVTPEEAVPVLRRYLREVAVARPYFDVTPDAPDEALLAEAPTHPVFAIRGRPGLGVQAEEQGG